MVFSLRLTEPQVLTNTFTLSLIGFMCRITVTDHLNSTKFKDYAPKLDCVWNAKFPFLGFFCIFCIHPTFQDLDAFKQIEIDIS